MQRKDLKVLLFLAGIVIFVALYLGVYNNYVTKTDAVRGEIETLTQKRDKLKGYEANLATYNAVIAESSALAKTTAQYYPNDVRAEDKIMFAVDVENIVKIPITTIAISEFQLVNAFPAAIENETGYVVDNVRLYKTSATYTATLTYDTVKNLLAYITSRPYRTTLNSISLSYDNSTGNLYGSFAVDEFYLTGLDPTYYPTVIGDVPKGTDNIFGTVDADND